MDRRNFFKSMLAGPFLSPLLLTSKTANRDINLYLIGDDPQLFLPIILEELQKFGVIHSRNFTFLNSHHKESGLKHRLCQNGWRFVQRPSQADLTLNFSYLRYDASSSFTLIRDGRIWDIRSWKLRTIWREMYENCKTSSCLTTASFETRPLNHLSGEFISVYKDGRKIEKILLGENVTESFRAKNGRIKVRVKDQKAWVVESSCRHKICTYSSPVSLAGERIICAPNHFLLEIERNRSVDTIIG